MVTFGSATWRKVSPLWPFCPPDGLPDRSRRLRVRGSRGGLPNPSLDGGLPLLELFSPSRRSSSATRACNAEFSARRRSISATTAAGAAAVSGAPSERGAFSGEVMDSLTHATIPASTPFLPWRTWAVTRLVLYPVHLRTRKSSGDMMRKLSVTLSQNVFHLLGTSF